MPGSITPRRPTRRRATLESAGITGSSSLEGCVVRETVRAALCSIAVRFSDDAPLVDERVLRQRYAALDAWPADSQLGLFVLAWILGSGFSIAGFRESVNALVPDFGKAARTIGMGSNPTLVTLGGIARCGLRNGALVVRWNLKSDILYWPLDLSACKGASFK
jgi:hypothetical protein